MVHGERPPVVASGKKGEKKRKLGEGGGSEEVERKERGRRRHAMGEGEGRERGRQGRGIDGGAAHATSMEVLHHTTDGRPPQPGETYLQQADTMTCTAGECIAHNNSEDDIGWMHRCASYLSHIGAHRALRTRVEQGRTSAWTDNGTGESFTRRMHGA